jgi:hypothetical protein
MYHLTQYSGVYLERIRKTTKFSLSTADHRGEILNRLDGTGTEMEG